MIKRFLSLSILTFTYIQTANAGEITINDCIGVARAQHLTASESERFDLQVTLQGNTPAPTHLLLISEESTVEADVVDGKADFSALRSGVYEICDEERLAKVSQATFIPSSEIRVASLGKTGLGAIAVGGAAIAIGMGGSSSDSGSSAPVAGNSLIGELKIPSTPATTSQAPIRAPASVEDCLNDSRLRPLSPFD